MPPLRARLDDIDLLAPEFLTSINQADGVPRSFTPAALDALKHYHWPGNVRELRNVVHRAAIIAEQPEIDTIELPATHAVHRVAASDAQRDVLSIPLGSSIADAERLLILATLERFDGARERAAESLGISLKTLYNRLREYGQLAVSPDR